MNTNLKKSLLRTITLVSEMQDVCEEGEEPRPVNEDWMRAMMRVYLLSQNA
ncbi:MAG: hypothetical protein ACP5FL_06305 [Thermoplasmatota archaeon]